MRNIRDKQKTAAQYLAQRSFAMRTLTVPALHGTETGGALGLSGRVDLALAQVLHRPREQADFYYSGSGQKLQDPTGKRQKSHTKPKIDLNFTKKWLTAFSHRVILLTILRDEAWQSLFKAIYSGPPIGAKAIRTAGSTADRRRKLPLLIELEAQIL